MKFELPRTLIVAAASALLLSACASNLVHRGAVIDVSLANTIQPGVDNKASVTKLLGSPTFVGQFQPDSWYYVSRSTRTSALHNPSLTRNLVVKVQFDAAGNVASIGGTGKELVMNVDPSNRQLRPSAARADSSKTCSAISARSGPAASVGQADRASSRGRFRGNPAFPDMTATPAGITYADYLKLRDLLSAQRPLSDLHDEMLFIIIHQTKELWMKQMLHELEFAIRLVDEDSFAPAYKALARVGRIQSVMTLSWDVLSTLTPVDYLAFRDVLGTSSGFQSAQFRELEFRLGIKDPRLSQTL